MKSDPTECLYCQNNETLHNLCFCLRNKHTEDVALCLTKTTSMI